MDDAKLETTPVKFDEAEYYKLRALMSDADRDHAILITAQRQAQATCAVRDVFLQKMAFKYGFDARFQRVQQNDETLEFSFS